MNHATDPAADHKATGRQWADPRRIITAAAGAAVVVTVFLVGASPDSVPDSVGPAQGPSPTPTVVPVEEFCVAFDSLSVTHDAFAVFDPGTTAADLKAKAGQVKELAARTTMPPRARLGVTYVMDTVLGLEDTDTINELAQAADTESSIDDSANATEFSTWINESCTPRVVR